MFYDLAKFIAFFGGKMVLEGLKLTVLGMGFVYIFLIVLVGAIILNARFCAKATQKECEAIGIEPAVTTDSSFHLMAVISAAIKKHREK